MITGRDDPQGLSIKGELKEYYENEIHYGRLYPNFDTVVDKELVYKDKGEADKRTNYYTITVRGRRELEDRWEWEDVRVYPEVSTTGTVCSREIISLSWTTRVSS
ncbi:transcriptional regulator PadR family protein, partial [Natrinema pellirubrum DSM 15624]